MQQETINRIIEEHKVWTKHNFDFEAPELGLVEELGELAHQFLKKQQNIRKTSEALEQDALADAIIFFFHLCWKYNHVPYAFTYGAKLRLHEHLGAAVVFAGKLLITISGERGIDTVNMYGVWEQINCIAEWNKWDLEKIVVQVWDQVKKRDFRKYPNTGLPPTQPIESGFDVTN